LYFTGDRASAANCFQSALKIKPDHATAKKFLDACQTASTQPAPSVQPKVVNGDL
jgi:hypothetical protein